MKAPLASRSEAALPGRAFRPSVAATIDPGSVVLPLERVVDVYVDGWESRNGPSPVLAGLIWSPFVVPNSRGGQGCCGPRSQRVAIRGSAFLAAIWTSRNGTPASNAAVMKMHLRLLLLMCFVTPACLASRRNGQPRFMKDRPVRPTDRGVGLGFGRPLPRQPLLAPRAAVDLHAPTAGYA
jgi:hypothetical protein